MEEEYIIDTSIWVDLYEDRKDYNNEPLGNYAFKLLVKIKAKESAIVLTDFLIRELETIYSVAEINGMFKPFEKIIKKIIATEKQWEEAKKIAKERDVPAGDALHVIIARDNNFILVTRDRHFRELEDISKHYKPEELI
ncbi:MAG TPA: PIN domain-containing protein [Candidatus Nanoarchaeia archaeon]|nr:PIN domain-containing protein [Candidatus Nanoarchaeia archaeon]